MCDLLIERGASWCGTNAYGCGAAHWLALRRDGSEAACEWLVQRGADASHAVWRAPNIAGHTPLHKAATRGSLTCMRWLLHHAALNALEVDAADADGNTALALAALWGQRCAAEQLLSAGASVDAVGFGGCTPLVWSLAMGHGHVAALLRERGAGEAAAAACGLMRRGDCLAG